MRYKCSFWKYYNSINDKTVNENQLCAAIKMYKYETIQPHIESYEITVHEKSKILCKNILACGSQHANVNTGSDSREADLKHRVTDVPASQHRTVMSGTLWPNVSCECLCAPVCTCFHIAVIMSNTQAYTFVSCFSPLR